jgi:pimeloyl-ACP methyl ester carboxylesterase
MVLAKLTYPAYKYIPTTYVYAEKDQAIVIPLQEFMVDKVRASGAEIETARWDTGHSPFFVDPEMVADFLASEAVKRGSRV